MLNLNSKIDRPDFNYLTNILKNSMDRGIRIEIPESLKNDLQNELVTSNIVMKDYGIMKPNSTRSIIAALKRLSEDEPLLKKYCYNNGKWTTNGSVLIPLVHNNVKFATDLIVYRKVSKYMATLNNLESFIDDNGLVHPLVCGSSTNRVQYREPGLLTIPKQLLWNVVKPREEGWSLYSIDIKNQEPWILINMLDISELKELLSIAGDTSLYDMLFALIYNRQATPIERSEFKRAWNAFTYGGSKKGVQSICYNIDGGKIYTYFTKLKEYNEYRSHMYAKASLGQRNINTLFGTELVANGKTKSELAKQLMDLGIQGTGVDILAFLVKHFDSEVKRRCLSDKMHLYFTRHDECIIEVHNSLEEELDVYGVCGLLGDIFEHHIDDWEPFKMQIKKIFGVINLFDDIENDLEEDED